LIPTLSMAGWVSYKEMKCHVAVCLCLLGVYGTYWLQLLSYVAILLVW
jgi:hypothetical protein